MIKIICINCINCKKIFKDYKTNYRKFCSYKCYWKFLEGKHSSPRTEFKKGMTSWNKGKKIPQFSQQNHPNWKNGRKKHDGYIQIFLPDHPSAIRKYVYEHRFIIEQQIGRFLKSSEDTHHLGKKDDNRPHRLMAFISKSAHHRFHKNPCNVKPKEIIFDGRLLS